MPCPTWRPSTRRLGLNLLLTTSLCYLFITSYSRSKPEFSSWSLVCMGSSHLYRFHEGQNFWSTLYLKLCFSNISISHSSGLGQQPGFISSAKFLLPWEVNLKNRSLSEMFVYLSGAVVKGHPTATGSEVALHPGEPCQESKSEEPWWACRG